MSRRRYVHIFRISCTLQATEKIQTLLCRSERDENRLTEPLLTRVIRQSLW
jgi:hypothetical protein